MTMLILPTTAEDNMELGARISYMPGPSFRGIKHIRQEDSLIVAAVGYDHWTPNSVQMHIWVGHPSGMSRTFIAEAFGFPFLQGQLGLAVGITPSNNAEALEFNRRIGFKEVYRCKDAWEVGVDMVLQELRREDCRWLKWSKQHGKWPRSKSISTATAGPSSAVA